MGTAANDPSTDQSERKLLAEEGDTPKTWDDYQSANLPPCGAIKIAPTIQIQTGPAKTDVTEGTIGDVSGWKCGDDKTTISLPYTVGTDGEAKTLEIHLQSETSQQLAAEYGVWRFTVSADGVDYGKNNTVAFPNYAPQSNYASGPSYGKCILLLSRSPYSFYCL